MNIVVVFYDMSHLIYNYFAYPPSFLSGFTDPVHISLKKMFRIFLLQKTLSCLPVKFPVQKQADRRCNDLRAGEGQPKPVKPQTGKSIAKRYK